MILSADSLKNIPPEKVAVPRSQFQELPEKVLQFGTGILLRGLCDYFIDKANRKGSFNGRVVMVKSTDRGSASAFEKQNGLYTLCVRGFENGKSVEENIIISSVSRVLSARSQWSEILKCAHNPELQIIISNTTEVGLTFVDEKINTAPPNSFPAKLLSFLWERFNAFENTENAGLVIIPTELIPGNGDLLKTIVLKLATNNNLSEAFIAWLEGQNHFCNSLVDRIVTGMPDPAIRRSIEEELGYEDDLLNVCEVYRLWAIEGGEEVRRKLEFSGSDEGILIEPDIELYRELKLRVLNATHTLTSGVAVLAGVETVREAMDDPDLGLFVRNLMKNEIGSSIPYQVDPNLLEQYIIKVIDRFRNPYLRHYWINITLNYSSKMKMRCVPLLVKYYELHKRAPRLFTLGFAAYLLFMKSREQKKGQFFGIVNNRKYLVDDERAGLYFETWQKNSPEDLVPEILANTELWGKDLNKLPGFTHLVLGDLKKLIDNGMRGTLKNNLIKQNLL
jgi:tagaturonate reductase